MKRVGAVIMTMVLIWATPGVASAAPWISCPGGYIVQPGQQCPLVRPPISVTPGGTGGGHGGNGGGLLGTIGRIIGGLGGL